MQKLVQLPITKLQSNGDVYPVPETGDTEVSCLLASPQTTVNSLRKTSFQSTSRQRKSHQVLEYTELLYVWNSYLSKKFSKSSFQLE
ncbi:unnamed protein product (macronuclear) [Paramecium tetraurelia]|uniref:Uncharacterized protein n=1 Tax=Paramecium tetraurelia TaxID=5888 RepID=A0CKI4_PARTE|nr:uncharacterized protein GSPATT00001015001 [Paramecium tetraurelia]CAK71301.1 unnamed protein product [Paramecium tetraurelia]|eukprot:XP_001438698.1 hypothetical protein (macronuclear) [Paramecium tetraurelia strain d4-2]